MLIQCQAAIAQGNGRFLIDTITVGEPQEDEVLVQMKAAGLCHTDFDSLSWGKPIVMGHEGAGIVKAVGSKVANVQVGDGVILNWAMPCMQCFQCQEGNQHICENNSPVSAGANGVTPDMRIWKAPNGMAPPSSVLSTLEPSPNIPSSNPLRW